MSPEAQRIAIAEACGYTLIRQSTAWEVSDPPEDPICLCGEHQVFGGERTEQIPDYLNDLNAMAEAEKALTDDQLADMAEALGVDADDAPADSWRLLLRATAAQRAEAMLKTLGLWSHGGKET